MVRTPCCKAELGLKKGAWSTKEDKKLISYLNCHGEGGWRTLPEKAGLKRCGKSCRLRWANYLRPGIKRGEFNENEEQSIIALHALHGNKWSAIARGLPGRTDNEIKNYWNTHIKKRLIKKGIDPVTHKGIISSTNLPHTPEKKNDVQMITSDDDIDDKKSKEKNKKSGISSARLLNRVANRFGKRLINQKILSQIIATGSPLITTATSVTTNDSESEKSTNSYFTPTPNFPGHVTVQTSPITSFFDGESNGNVDPTMSSSTFSDFANDPLIYCGNFVGNNVVNDLGFSSFLNEKDFMMLDESCLENTMFMKELTKFLHEDDQNDDVEVTPVFERQHIFDGTDNYFI